MPEQYLGTPSRTSVLATRRDTPDTVVARENVLMHHSPIELELRQFNKRTIAETKQ